jgi:C1A family cysteine protease
MARSSSLSRVPYGSYGRKALCLILSLVLALSLNGGTSALAFAADAVGSAAEGASAALAASEASSASSDGSSSTESQYEFIKGKTTDSSFDLRDPNCDGDRSDSVVTPVKSQGAWGTCWAFASIAAAETSILAKQRDQGQAASADSLDLSELHLGWWAHSTVPDSYGTVKEDGQSGEGYHASLNLNKTLGFGGDPQFASSLFAAGVGPTTEEDEPYLPKILRPGDGESATSGVWYLCAISFTDGKSGNLPCTEEMIAKLKERDDVKSVKKGCYSPVYLTDDGKTEYVDWSVPESKYGDQAFELSESYLLPDMVTKDSSGNYVSTNQDSIDAVKKQLIDGRAVVTGFCADQAQLGQESSAKYINLNTWAHYTNTNESANHAVTIVGWDDNYSKSNFLHSDSIQGDGAWLVKNSWGSDTEDFPNDGSWGIVENGKHTGYFWISYYDHSLAGMEAFDFDINHTLANTTESQYDYLTYTHMLTISKSTDPVSSANVFTAATDIRLRSVTCQTVVPNTTVEYSVYLLDGDATSPISSSGPVATFTQTYATAGYHRYLPDEVDWIAMRAGQKYSVVVAQYTTDDTGKKTYYQEAGGARRQLTEDEVNQTYDYLVKQFTSTSFATSRDTWKNMCMKGGSTEAEAKAAIDNYVQYLVDSGMGKADAEAYAEQFRQYLISGGMDEAAAEAAGELYASFYTNSNDFKKQLESKKSDIKAQCDILAATYYEAKVNKGESFSVAADGTYTDWTDVISAFTKDELYSGFVIDNVPIKTFADNAAFATVDSIDELKAKFDEASNVLKSVVVSADGSDVPVGRKWMTQEAYDNLNKAVSHANVVLSLVGDDWHNVVANTTPEQDVVDEALAALTWETSESLKFIDVDYDNPDCQWYVSGVSFCAAAGLMQGYANGNGNPTGYFGVGNTLSRAELAVILWRHFEPEAAAAYDEVTMATTKAVTSVNGVAVSGITDGVWYTAAANWAVENGIINGFEKADGSRDFAADSAVSFEQLISVIANASAADVSKADVSVLSKFADAADVSSWATASMAYAVEAGLVNGYDGKILAPGEDVKRERVATILMNAFDEGILK